MKFIQLELDLQLDQVESQITQLLSQNETNWKEVAKLAIVTQNKELYKEGKFNSFTAWVSHIAQKSHRQPSLIWRYIKASKYYLQQVGSQDLDKIGEIKAAPEALERLEKVERQAPAEVFEKLREKVLSGSATVAECRQIEQDYRPLDAKTNRGRPPKGEEGTYQHLGLLQDGQVNSGQIARNQIALTILRSLKSKINLVDWISRSVGRRQLPRYYKDHSEVRVTLDGQRRRLDFVAVARWTFKRPKDLFVIEIKSCLQDFLADEKWQDYLDFCHYFCFACPAGEAELIEAIASLTPDFVGIIGVNLTAEIQADLSYPVILIRPPFRQEGIMVTSLFETLYERVLGWSANGSAEDGNENDDEDDNVESVM